MKRNTWIILEQHHFQIKTSIEKNIAKFDLFQGVLRFRNGQVKLIVIIPEDVYCLFDGAAESRIAEAHIQKLPAVILKDKEKLFFS